MTDPNITIQYAGSIQLLCELSRRCLMDEDDNDRIEAAVADWCKQSTGWTYRRIGARSGFYLISPLEAGNAQGNF